MPPVIIVDNEYITVQYLPEIRSIYHIIHKPIDGQPLKDALSAGTDALKQYGVCKWLSDDRKNGQQSEDFFLWGLKEWSPRTVAAGWKYWAIVVPVELASAGTMAPAIESFFELGLRVMVFTDVEKAKAWLNGFEG